MTKKTTTRKKVVVPKPKKETKAQLAVRMAKENAVASEDQAKLDQVQERLGDRKKIAGSKITSSPKAKKVMGEAIVFESDIDITELLDDSADYKFTAEESDKHVVDCRGIRIAIRSHYELQQSRIRVGQRIIAAFRYKLGLAPSQAEGEDKEAVKLMEQIRKEYKRVTDGVKRITVNWKSDSKLLTSRAELAMIEAYERYLQIEELHVKAVADELLREKIFTEYLTNIRGCGTLMSGVIVSEINILKANSSSALIAYVGLDVVEVTKKDGTVVREGRGKKDGHLVARSYTNRAGEVKETTGITFNPLIKTKMVGVLATSFLRAGGEFKEVYDNYKHRLNNMPAHKDKSKGHIHNMAMRYMIKEFMKDLWLAWRIIEDLPTRPHYEEEKLHLIHSGPDRAALANLKRKYHWKGHKKAEYTSPYADEGNDDVINIKPKGWGVLFD